MQKGRASIRAAKLYPSVFYLLTGRLVVRRSLLQQPKVEIRLPEWERKPFDLDELGDFLHRIRRMTSRADFFQVCCDYLDHEEPMPLEPFRLELKAADLLAGEHR